MPQRAHATDERPGVPRWRGLLDPARRGAPAAEAARPRGARLRDLLQEVRELGPAGFAFRVRWELAVRSGWIARTERAPAPLRARVDAAALLARLPFARAPDVAAAVGDRVSPAARRALAERARAAARGRIRC